MKKNILDFTIKELESIISEKGRPKYRAKQVFNWLYVKGAGDFRQMRNLPNPFLDKLEEDFFINSFFKSKKYISRDKTIKILFALLDGECVETVVIRSSRRNTICISTQAGCSFACAFCASGKQGLRRNLSTAEIISQILHVKFNLQIPLTNYVFMGMGEPLDNFDSLSKAISIMNDKYALNIGARRITISTCGIIPAIKKLNSVNTQLNLSISLHAATDSLRSRLMPVNKKYPLKALVKTIRGHNELSGRIITLEYVLIKGVNDTPQDAQALAETAKDLKAKINIIPFSPVRGVAFSPPLKKGVDNFMDMLTKANANATLRMSKGADINAACGQLAGKRHAL